MKTLIECLIFYKILKHFVLNSSMSSPSIGHTISEFVKIISKINLQFHWTLHLKRWGIYRYFSYQTQIYYNWRTFEWSPYSDRRGFVAGFKWVQQWFRLSSPSNLLRLFKVESKLQFVTKNHILVTFKTNL